MVVVGGVAMSVVKVIDMVTVFYGLVAAICAVCMVGVITVFGVSVEAALVIVTIVLTMSMAIV